MQSKIKFLGVCFMASFLFSSVVKADNRPVNTNSVVASVDTNVVIEEKVKPSVERKAMRDGEAYRVEYTIHAREYKSASSSVYKAKEMVLQENLSNKVVFVEELPVKVTINGREIELSDKEKRDSEVCYKGALDGEEIQVIYYSAGKYVEYNCLNKRNVSQGEIKLSFYVKADENDYTQFTDAKIGISKGGENTGDFSNQNGYSVGYSKLSYDIVEIRSDGEEYSTTIINEEVFFPETVVRPIVKMKEIFNIFEELKKKFKLSVEKKATKDDEKKAYKMEYSLIGKNSQVNDLSVLATDIQFEEKLFPQIAFLKDAAIVYTIDTDSFPMKKVSEENGTITYQDDEKKRTLTCSESDAGSVLKMVASADGLLKDGQKRTLSFYVKVTDQEKKDNILFKYQQGEESRNIRKAAANSGTHANDFGYDVGKAKVIYNIFDERLNHSLLNQQSKEFGVAVLRPFIKEEAMTDMGPSTQKPVPPVIVDPNNGNNNNGNDNGNNNNGNDNGNNNNGNQSSPETPEKKDDTGKEIIVTDDTTPLGSTDKVESKSTDEEAVESEEEELDIAEDETPQGAIDRDTLKEEGEKKAKNKEGGFASKVLAKTGGAVLYLNWMASVLGMLLVGLFSVAVMRRKKVDEE